MTKEHESALRNQLITAMRGDQSHVDFESATKDFPPHLRGLKPAGAPHSAWQLLEHLRIAQHDILEFSRNPKHKSPKWPEGYWPKTMPRLKSRHGTPRLMLLSRTRSRWKIWCGTTSWIYSPPLKAATGRRYCGRCLSSQPITHITSDSSCF